MRYEKVEVGQVVFSKCGRDRGFPFLVLRMEGDFAFLVDGRYRTLEKPKKKKIKHLAPTSFISKEILKEQLLDSDLRKILAAYGQNSGHIKPGEVSFCQRKM